MPGRRDLRTLVRGARVPATIALTLALNGPARAEEPRVTAIDLGQSGVALYTLTQDAEGAGPVELSVPEDHADDVLASLLVRDPAGGVVGVTTATPATAPEALRGTPFADGLPQGVEALLRALTGRSVRVVTQHGDVTGTVLSLGRVQEALGDSVVDRASVLLLTPEGTVAEVVLSPGASVALPEGSAAPLATAAGSGTGTDALRRFDLALSGTGPRRIALSYVTEAPAWKNAWRLSLAEKRLQGWATFENTSGHDWKGVEVTLSTGTPVAYRRALLAPSRIARADAPDVMPDRPDVRPDAGFAQPRAVAPAAPVMDAMKMAEAEPAPISPARSPRSPKRASAACATASRSRSTCPRAGPRTSSTSTSRSSRRCRRSTSRTGRRRSCSLSGFPPTRRWPPASCRCATRAASSGTRPSPASGRASRGSCPMPRRRVPW